MILISSFLIATNDAAFYQTPIWRISRSMWKKGGAVLVAAGADFASANSLYRSPLRRIVPAEPSARVFNEGYTPRVSDIGGRHPVTLGLPQQNEWGRWFRQIDVTPTSGHVLMTGIDEAPLLILDRVGEGVLRSFPPTMHGFGIAILKGADRSWNCCVAWPIG